MAGNDLDDDLVICSICGVKLRRSKTFYHGSKCRKSNGRVYTCQYNVEHIFSSEKECEEHTKTCDSAKAVSHCMDDITNSTCKARTTVKDKHLTECEAAKRILNSGNSDDDDQTESNILPVNGNNSPTTDDWGAGEWAAEATSQSYNPQEVVQNRAVPQNVIGLSRAQRRRHRMQERRRINDLTQNGTGSSNN